MHRNAQELFAKFATPYIQEGMSVLEIGPDNHPSTIRKTVTTENLDWKTLDIAEDPQLTYPGQKEYQFSIPDEQFDIVLSVNVIEHVKEIWSWMPELARVCKKGGHVITVNPVTWPYHEYPVDCWRIYPDGMRSLYDSAGLQPLKSVCASMEVAEFSKQTHADKIFSKEGALTLENFTSENLKLLGIKHLVPGVGNPSSVFKTKIKRWLGWPIVVSFDTVTIGQKK